MWGFIIFTPSEDPNWLRWKSGLTRLGERGLGGVAEEGFSGQQERFQEGKFSEDRTKGLLQARRGLKKRGDSGRRQVNPVEHPSSFRRTVQEGSEGEEC